MGVDVGRGDRTHRSGDGCVGVAYHGVSKVHVTEFVPGSMESLGEELP
ncbi:MAG: hypothetical protein ABJH68_08970 [Ilumatobacter sp.]